MRLFTKQAAAEAAPVSTLPAAGGGQNLADFDLQEAPFQAKAGGVELYIKVDSVYSVGQLVLIAGWRIGRPEVTVAACKQGKLFEIDRPDVSAHFKRPEGEKCGFILLIENFTEELAAKGLRLEISKAGMHWQSKALDMQAFSSQDVAASANSGDTLSALLRDQQPFTPLWSALCAMTPSSQGPCKGAKGFIELAMLSEHDHSALLVGWAVHDSQTLIWLEDDTGNTWPLDNAYRYFRADVYEAVKAGFGQQAAQAGFIAYCPEPSGPHATYRVRGMDADGLYTVSEYRAGNMPVDAVAAARWLLPQWSQITELHERIPHVDAPLLGRLLEIRQENLASLPVRQQAYGAAPASPEVSIIVPLYGRADFVEHQFIEYARDPWLQANAEIIYVLDDPTLVGPFKSEAESLYQLYRIPFKWIWGSVNRGFSGANNLGAAHASGRKLLFLNSDAFPRAPGWLQSMIAALDARADIGVISPRLLFADGAIQHAGMEFRHRADLGIWINHHPLMGLAPELDPTPALTEMPAVTGACMLLRREDFDRIGGWDTGYLIGDFEDSDLCFKLRQIGLIPAYMPEVELTHLERQSFKLLGSDEFRTRVVIFNAVRHQQRWGAQIAALSQHKQETRA